MKGTGNTRQVVWTSSKPPGVEYCTVRSMAAGWTLQGSLVRRAGSGAAVVSYLIEVDREWRTRMAVVEAVLGGKRAVRQLEATETGWLVDGTRDRRFDICVDVDFQASPVTNTLPIKRMGMKVGEKVDLTACWVKFPTLDVATIDQSYERMGKNVYRYSSATGFSAKVEVDAFGLVRRYGDYWYAV